MPVLNSTVIVRDDNFVSHVFLAGDEPPKWAVDKISNRTSGKRARARSRPLLQPRRCQKSRLLTSR